MHVDEAGHQVPVVPVDRVDCARHGARMNRGDDSAGDDDRAVPAWRSAAAVEHGHAGDRDGWRPSHLTGRGECRGEPPHIA